MPQKLLCFLKREKTIWVLLLLSFLQGAVLCALPSGFTCAERGSFVFPPAISRGGHILYHSQASKSRLCSAQPLPGFCAPYLSAEASNSPVAAQAGLVTAGLSTTEEKAMALFQYIAGNFTYDEGFAESVRQGEVRVYVPEPARTLSTKTGICYDMAALYTAMLKSVSIPVRLIKGQSAPAGGYHAWNSIYDVERGAWVALDVTLHLGNPPRACTYIPLESGYEAEAYG